MRALPAAVKQQVKECLWRRADALGWHAMTVIDKAKQYGVWTEDPEIGGVLAGYMDARKVRTYIKDTLMKPYARASLSDAARVLKALRLPEDQVRESYERPHGLHLQSRRVVCWGKADNWKLILMAVHERAYALGVPPFAAVLLPPLTRFLMRPARMVVEDAATKLGIQRLAWLDPKGELHDAEAELFAMGA